MNARRCLALIGFACFASTGNAIEMWHSSTVWVNHGMCSAQFLFDGGLDATEQLRVHVRAVDQRGQIVARTTLEIPSLAESSANRYASAFFEGEALCEPVLTIQVVKARAVIEGKRVDLLKTRSLTARDFKPFSIHVNRQ